MHRSLGLVALLLLAPLAQAAPPAPLYVAVLPLADAGAIVAWLPGAPADAYNVYGISETGAATLLATVTGDTLWTVVLGSFPMFGVAAVVEGVESLREDGSGCAGARMRPPGVFVGNGCLPPLDPPGPGPGKIAFQFELEL